MHVSLTVCGCPKASLQHSRVCAQQCWEASSLNRNSHLVNFTDALCRHQWTVADNVVQPAGHNLYQNIQHCPRLHNHCPFDHGMTKISQDWKVLWSYCPVFCFFPSTIVLPILMRSSHQLSEINKVANIDAVGSCFQTSNLFCIHSLSTSVMRLWQSGPQLNSSHSLCEAQPRCINFPIVCLL